MYCSFVDRREKLLLLAVSVAILGTASLYLLSASPEHKETGLEKVLSVKSILDNPEEHLDEDIVVLGNISGIKNYTNFTVFYLKDGDYSLTCISYSNLTLRGGPATVTGKFVYNDKWGNYEIIAGKISYETPS